jgi:hypothetical protein
MYECLEVEYEDRPSFKEVVPLLEQLLSDYHKEVNINYKNKTQLFIFKCLLLLL